MYLGSASVIKMQSFIEGFAFAFIDNEERKRDPLYDGFGQWVIDQRKTGQYPWSAIAMLIGGSEAGAFEVAKELWREYKHQNRPD